MDDAGAGWLLAAPLVVIGALLLALGWRGAARRAAATSGWGRWWSTAALLPAVGTVLVAMGVLFALGFPEAALGLMYFGAGVAIMVGLVAAVRVARAGEWREAAWTAGLPLFLLVSFTFIVLGWDTASAVLLAVVGGGLLVLSVATAARRWRAADGPGRRDLLQSIALGFGLSCQAAAQLLPAPSRALSLVLALAGGASLLVAFGLILDARRRRRSTSVPADPAEG